MFRICFGALVVVLLVGGAAYADLSPAINLETEADWIAAIGTSAVRPMTAIEFGDLGTANPFGSPFLWAGDYSEPQLHVYGGGHTLDPNVAETESGTATDVDSC